MLRPVLEGALPNCRKGLVATMLQLNMQLVLPQFFKAQRLYEQVSKKLYVNTSSLRMNKIQTLNPSP